jgi:hypothetical protein
MKRQRSQWGSRRPRRLGAATAALTRGHGGEAAAAPLRDGKASASG